RSDGLKFRHENGVLHIDSGDLGGPLPPAATQPAAPPPAPADTETAAPATTHLRADEALWVPVGRWSGQGQKETPRFRVGAGQWRLVTTAGEAPGTVHGRVQVQVVDGGGRTIAGVTLLGPAADTGYVHAEPGLFHLRVGSFGAPWTVVVEEKRVPAERLPKGRR
ncbi:MAG TPA: hypothetical protein VHG91_03150, partial [Longimicrobium sp.]|nr:hypothetical protein [Longimicrobium sp.]